MSSPSQKPTKAEVQALVKPIDDAIEGLAKSQIRLLLVSLILAEEVKVRVPEAQWTIASIHLMDTDMD